MRQIVIIHGGYVFRSREEYLAYLHDYRIESLDYFKRTDWKPGLEAALGSGYEVLLPRLPCKENAKYVEWKVWFEKLVPFLSEDVVLVGHSLGGKFLAKLLSENRFPKNIRATILIAAPFERSTRQHTDFVLPDSLNLFSSQGGKILLYHSKDDPVVAYGEFEKYRAALPSAAARVFEDRGHFNQKSFPELVADIKGL